MPSVRAAGRSGSDVSEEDPRRARGDHGSALEGSGAWLVEQEAMSLIAGLLNVALLLMFDVIEREQARLWLEGG